MAEAGDATSGMRKKSSETKKRVDQELQEREAKVLSNTSIDLEAYRPDISDEKSFDQLIKAVQESTAKNENIAQLQQRITALGKGVVAVAKEVAAFV